MTQELIELRASLIEGRYEDALALVDDLEDMSKQAILRNIESFLVRLLVHLIKNQVEQRLTNSWVASIIDSLRQIQKLNRKGTKTAYYIQPDAWTASLAEALMDAVTAASVETLQGRYTPLKLMQLLDESQLTQTAQSLVALTYQPSAQMLLESVYPELRRLPGGQDWVEGR